MTLGQVDIPPLHGTVADMLAHKSSVVHAVPPDATVLEAIAQMDSKRVGALLVMQGDKLVGILSERDYTRKVILLGRASRDTRVSEIMTAQVIVVRPQMGLGECLQLVTNHGIRHLPVVDGGQGHRRAEHRRPGACGRGAAGRDDHQPQVVHRQRLSDLSVVCCVSRPCCTLGPWTLQTHRSRTLPRGNPASTAHPSCGPCFSSWAPARSWPVRPVSSCHCSPRRRSSFWLPRVLRGPIGPSTNGCSRTA